jgi:hypothetical protein
MSITFRQFAVSGSAAIALLGGAAAIGVAAAPTASAAEMQTVAERAVTAPVTLSDGRTMRIAGMGGYGHQATAEHVATVAAYRTDTQDPAGITTGNTADDGTSSQLQNPYNTGQIPAGYNQQITTQASGGTVAVGVVSILILAIIVFYKVKHGGLRAADAALGVVAGVAVGGTFLGPMIQNMTNSLVGSLGSMLSSLG